MINLTPDSNPEINDELDFLINSWEEDPFFDQVQAEQGKIDDEMWK